MDAVREIQRRFRHGAKGQGNREREKENKRQKKQKWRDRKKLARVVEHGGSEPGSMNI